MFYNPSKKLWAPEHSFSQQITQFFFGIAHTSLISPHMRFRRPRRVCVIYSAADERSPEYSWQLQRLHPNIAGNPTEIVLLRSCYSPSVLATLQWANYDCKRGPSVFTASCLIIALNLLCSATGQQQQEEEVVNFWWWCPKCFATSIKFVKSVLTLLSLHLQKVSTQRW